MNVFQQILSKQNSWQSEARPEHPADCAHCVQVMFESHPRPLDSEVTWHLGDLTLTPGEATEAGSGEDR